MQMEAIKNHGIIYKITNKINGKVYIGKTKQFYGNNSTPFGAEGRFKAHIRDALANRSHDCEKLNRAIRKYGWENFYVEEILKCDLNDIDKHEVEQIKKYDSTNTGYNIALGGRGRSVVKVSEDARKNISKSQNKSGEMNIIEYHKNGKLIGYYAKRREKGIQYQKLFSNTKNTPEDNLQLAKDWINDLKDNKLTNNKYNKKNDLPQNISPVEDKNNHNIIGYKVSIMINGKKNCRNFQDKNLSLDEKLKLANEWMNDVKSNTLNPDKYAKKRDVPEYISVIKNQNKTDIIGYRVAIPTNGKKIGRSFQDQTLSLEEKLQLAIKYKESISSKNH